MEAYNPKQIESKWQEKWEREGAPRAKDFDGKPKQYFLVEFPYPSGAGLHVGHVRSYTALDVMARKARMEGKNVLYPIGWDAFGLPTENYAIKNKIHPRQATEENIAVFRRQLKQLGISFDWSREVNTTDPEYYKWTQWIFLQMFKRGLAYKAKMPINWCPSCKIGLANEEVVDGKCERCGTETERREKEQWMLKITAYADRLIDDLETVDYSERIRASQVNWIGRSNGAEITFQLHYSSRTDADGTRNDAEKISEVKVFTTRPDTLFGATYLVFSPENKILENLKSEVENWGEVEKYIEAAKKKTEIERTAEGKEKTGVEVKGIKAVNPASGEEVPVFVADYVLVGYGTGAIMAVPAHDARDFEFAKKYGLPIREVIKRREELDSRHAYRQAGFRGNDKKDGKKVYEGEGVMINSGEFDGMASEEAKEKITEKVGGKKTVHYHLRDWVFSRQHYWGEPIPLIYCENCSNKLKEISNDELRMTNDGLDSRHAYRQAGFRGNDKGESGNNKAEDLGEKLNPGWVGVGEEELPVRLPEVESYEPTETGESPLAGMESWVKVKCPKCGGEARRETDTMPNWAGSSWYFLRYIDPKSNEVLADKEKMRYWMPVDFYNGGMEHTTLHLLYSRFWYKFLYDIGAVPKEAGVEPYLRRRSHGVVLAEDGRKMSKSYGNVVNPDEIVERYGADALRVYELFMGPFSDMIPWSTNGLKGTRRFLEKVWNLKDKIALPQGQGLKNNLEKLVNQTIKKVGEDIEAMKFNTAVSQLMIAANAMAAAEEIPRELWKKFVKVLSPIAPHLAEELWEQSGNGETVFEEEWPEYNKEAIRGETVRLAVQVGGKLRAVVEAPVGVAEEQAVELAQKEEKVKARLEGVKVRKIIFVPDKLINFVI